MKRSGRTHLSKNPFPREHRRPKCPAETQTTYHESGTDAFDMDTDCYPGSLQEPAGHHEAENEQPMPISTPAEAIPTAEEEVPLSTLWDIELDYDIDKISGGRDFYDELKDSLLMGDKLFATPLAPLKDELGLQDNEFGFGIELPLGESLVSSSTFILLTQLQTKFLRSLVVRGRV